VPHSVAWSSTEGGLRTTDEQEYQYALDIFNQTIANMSSFIDSARADAIRELDNLNAGSSDPADAAAYGMTMNGVDQIDGITDHVFDTIGNASNYFIDNSSTATLQTEHTSVAQPLASAPIDSFGSLFAHAASDPGQFVQTNSTGFMVLGVIFSLLLCKFLFLHK
jgi:hypothetical protein